MSKAVMLSIKPKWCELILSGKKTVEVRKSRPQLDTPFKCYIYCTKDKSKLLFVDERHENYTIPHIANGKVIGEFVCGEIELLDIEQTNCLSKSCKDINALKDNSCLDSYDLLAYLQSKNGYAWHISDLAIYDKPKELEKFRHECESCCIPYLYDMPCENCNANRVLPPQSWQYVEELKR